MGTTVSSGRRVLRFAFVCGVIFLITGLLAEGALRVFDPLGLASFADGSQYTTELLTPAEGFTYIHRANASAKLRTMDIATNGQGFRWTEFPAQPADKQRVIILGDSIVFGWGVQIEQTFGTKLQRSYPSIEFLAAGAASWNTRTEYEWLKRVGIHYNPDTVVLVVSHNDVLPTVYSTIRPSSLMKRFLGESNLTMHALYLLGHRDVSRRFGALLEEGSTGWHDAEQSLQSTVELCDRNAIQLIVVMYDPLSSEFRRSVYERYKAVLNRYGIEFLRFPDTVYHHQISPADSHPNGMGHTLMAEWLGSLLTEGSR